MNEREVWESEFQQCFLAPVFSNTTNLINQALITMLNAGKLTERPLERLAEFSDRKFYRTFFLHRWSCGNA